MTAIPGETGERPEHRQSTAETFILRLLAAVLILSGLAVMLLAATGQVPVRL